MVDLRFELAVTQHSRNTPQFYLTAPSPCPYLPGQEERKVFTHLVGDKAGRAQRPAHPWRLPPQPVDRLPAGLRTCRACVSVRVVADDFRPSRSMRRVLERNADLIGDMRGAVPTSEQYSVFRAYLDARHRDGGMADMTVLDYAMMVEDSHVETRMVEYRKRGSRQRHHRPRRGELIAVALTDVLSDGLSMVYSFFEPTRQRSLGTFMILDHIARAAPGAALRLSRLLGRGLQEDGLQGPLPAAAAARPVMDRGPRRAPSMDRDRAGQTPNARRRGGAAPGAAAPVRGAADQDDLVAYFEPVSRETRLPITLYLNPGPGADVSIPDTIALARLPRRALHQGDRAISARVSRLIVEIDRAGHAALLHHHADAVGHARARRLRRDHAAPAAEIARHVIDAFVAKDYERAAERAAAVRAVPVGPGCIAGSPR